MHKVDESYIAKAIEELVDLLGIKEDIPEVLLLNHFNGYDIKGCIQEIAQYLGLPIAINLSYVTNQKHEKNTLAKTSKVGGFIAQVEIPGFLPTYGSSALIDFPINIKVNNDFRGPFEALVCIMAHELSHILLHSLMYKEKDNEYYTDLTPMILGFSNMIMDGRRVIQETQGLFGVETLTTTYGYLSDELFSFAYHRIRDILLEHNDIKLRLIKAITGCTMQAQLYRKELGKFNMFLEYLDKNQSKKIKSEDSLKIVSFHGVDYKNEFEKKLAGYEIRIKEAREFCEGFIHYTKTNLDSLKELNEEAFTLTSGINEELKSLKKDVSTLEKYVGLLYRFRVNRTV